LKHASKKIGSVQRAIDILNLFKSQSPELGTTEIARALGLHKSTTASLIYTLEANGFLSQNPTTRKYRLGLQVVERAFAMLDQFEVRQIAYPHLRALRDEWNETVNLAILDGFEVVYVERMLGTKALGMRSEVGRREPVHSTALGKALIACMPNEKVKELIKSSGLPVMTSKTITDPERLLAELEQVREQGYAVDDEENEIGGRCVGVPIFDHTGQAAAAVSISAPTARFPLSDVPQAGAMVVKTAKAISRELGYLPRAF
jgi:IclR family KDG regulon transcriptional repressor